MRMGLLYVSHLYSLRQILLVSLSFCLLLLFLYFFIFLLPLFGTPICDREGYFNTHECNLGHGTLSYTLPLALMFRIYGTFITFLYNSIHSNQLPSVFSFVYTKHCWAISLSLFPDAGFSLIWYSFGHSFPVTAKQMIETRKGYD